jgi:hypothetical protein
MCQFNAIPGLVQDASSRTGEGLKGSCRLLLELFSEVTWEEKVVDIALIAQGVLVMRANGGIEMVLDLQYLSVS